MNNNLQGFDANDSPTETGFDAIPAGTYRCMMVKSESGPTSTNSGILLSMQWKVMEGPHKGSILFDRLNFTNKDATAQKLGRAKLGNICRAVGIRAPSDSSELHNIPVDVTCITKPHYKNQGEFQNDVKDDAYARVGGQVGPPPPVGGMAVPPQTIAPPAPPEAQQEQQQFVQQPPQASSVGDPNADFVW